jgi:hypothetical protein
MNGVEGPSLPGLTVGKPDDAVFRALAEVVSSDLRFDL